MHFCNLALLEQVVKIWRTLCVHHMRQNVYLQCKMHLDSAHEFEEALSILGAQCYFSADKVNNAGAECRCACTNSVRIT